MVGIAVGFLVGAFVGTLVGAGVLVGIFVGVAVAEPRCVTVMRTVLPLPISVMSTVPVRTDVL